MTDAPKDVLVAVAERLIAEHGIDGVSLRDISKQAGQRNNSAVQYHFGGRDGLVREVFKRRMTTINESRRALLASRGDGPDGGLEGGLGERSLRELVEAMLLPLADHLRAAGSTSTYLQFMARVSPTVDFDDADFAEVRALHVEIAVQIRRRLDHLDPGTAARRIPLALTMGVAALAAFEQQWAQGLVDGDDQLDAVVDDIVALTVGALRAS